MACAKRLFVIEFITGGGLADEPLPGALAHEGELMLAALLGELSAIPGIKVTTTRDHRLSPLSGPARCVTIGPSDDPFAVWGRCTEDTDAVWPIAPETGGVLERLSRLVLEQGRQLIGSSPEAIGATARKHRCAEILRRAGVPAIPTRPLQHGIPESDSGWVVKPDDGAGCTETFYFDDARALRAFAAGASNRGYVVQPYIAGTPASLSVLCRDGHAVLLSCNEQRIGRQVDRLSFEGVLVNALRRERPAFEPLARAIAGIMPGLAGYVGVDLILTPSGPIVVEVNPRLTTAYVGLAEALDINVAAAILGVFDRQWCPARGHPPR
ncbi:MAG: ATP-grasp domain-containing protein [Pseudomonadota bacterium]|nr:ATP-grasp domain-containing protein [Pseudomonadota bacterium]